HGDHPPASRRPDAPPFQATEMGGRGNAGRCRHEGRSGAEGTANMCNRNRRCTPQVAASLPVTQALHFGACLDGITPSCSMAGLAPALHVFSHDDVKNAWMPDTKAGHDDVEKSGLQETRSSSPRSPHRTS